jgi:hypothetical protein
VIARLSDRYTPRVHISFANPSSRAIASEVQPETLRSHSKPKTFRIEAIAAHQESAPEDQPEMLLLLLRYKNPLKGLFPVASVNIEVAV